MPTRSYFGLKRSEILGLCIALVVLVILIVVAAPLVHAVLKKLLTLNPTLVYIVVGLLVFAEAAIFIGFIFPGETATIIAGVIASQGRVNIVALIILVVVAAIAGDSVGYGIGHTFGDRILNLKLITSRRAGIDWALELLNRRGAIAVFIARFTAFLRAVMPALAGAARMRYRTFFLANATGGLVWGVGSALAGYLVGNAYQRAEKYASWVSSALLIIIAVVAFTIFIFNKRREAKAEQAALSKADASGETNDPTNDLNDFGPSKEQ